MSDVDVILTIKNGNIIKYDYVSSDTDEIYNIFAKVIKIIDGDVYVDDIYCSNKKYSFIAEWSVSSDFINGNIKNISIVTDTRPDLDIIKEKYPEEFI